MMILLFHYRHKHTVRVSQKEFYNGIPRVLCGDCYENFANYPSFRMLTHTHTHTHTHIYIYIYFTSLFNMPTHARIPRLKLRIESLYVEFCKRDLLGCDIVWPCTFSLTPWRNKLSQSRGTIVVWLTSVKMEAAGSSAALVTTAIKLLHLTVNESSPTSARILQYAGSQNFELIHIDSS
jgi:hypothetical protein